MASMAQIEANRRNARKSTGPKTAEGKAVSRCNAWRHGFFCETVVVRDEEAGADFASLREAMLRVHDPRNTIETWLVDQIVLAQWKLRLVQGAEMPAGLAWEREMAWEEAMEKREQRLINRVLRLRRELREAQAKEGGVRGILCEHTGVVLTEMPGTWDAERARRNEANSVEGVDVRNEANLRSGIAAETAAPREWGGGVAERNEPNLGGGGDVRNEPNLESDVTSGTAVPRQRERNEANSGLGIAAETAAPREWVGGVAERNEPNLGLGITSGTAAPRQFRGWNEANWVLAAAVEGVVGRSGR